MNFNFYVKNYKSTKIETQLFSKVLQLFKMLAHY